MTTPDRPRFSLRSLMAFVLLAGIGLAGTVHRTSPSSPDPITIVSAALLCLQLAIFFRFRRLSRWMWLNIAAVLAQPAGNLAGLPRFLEGWASAGGIPWLLFHAAWMASTALWMIGMFLVFRDVQRRLLSCEATIRSLAAADGPAESEMQPSSGAVAAGA